MALRARCRRLEAAADEIVFPAVWDLIETSFYPGERDAARLERGKARLAAEHAALDKELTGRAWLCGEFSVADIATFIMVHAAAGLGAPPAEGNANLRAWVARMHERPAVKREVEETSRFLQGLFAPAT